MAAQYPSNKLIILNRDGVLNPLANGETVANADAWQPIAGSMDAVAFLTQAGYTVVVATQQLGLGSGLLSMQALNEIHSKMHQQIQKAGGRIDGIWLCPYSTENDCDCYKLKTGMIGDILARFKRRAEHTWLVSDGLRDLQLIEAAGGHAVLVLTGKGKQTLSTEKLSDQVQVFDSLLAFSQYLIQQEAKGV